jgi:hypothetical protein
MLNLHSVLLMPVMHTVNLLLAMRCVSTGTDTVALQQ